MQLPLGFDDLAVSLGVDKFPIPFRAGVRDLFLLNRAVLVGVIPGQQFLPGGEGHLPARVVLRSVEPADINGVPHDHGNRLHLARQSLNPPHRLAVARGIDIHPKACRRQDQRSSVSTLDHRWGGGPAQRFRPGLLPANLAVALAHRHDEGVLVLIDHEHHNVVGQYRRNADSIDIFERAQGQPPPLLPVACVAQQSEIGKERIDVLAVGHWSWGSGIIQGVQLFVPGTRSFLFPQDRARCPVPAKCVEPLVLDASQIDAPGRDHGRRVPGRQFRAPDKILAGSELCRQSSALRDSGSVRPPKAFPLPPCCATEQYEKAHNSHAPSWHRRWERSRFSGDPRGAPRFPKPAPSVAGRERRGVRPTIQGPGHRKE